MRKNPSTSTVLNLCKDKHNLNIRYLYVDEEGYLQVCLPLFPMEELGMALDNTCQQRTCVQNFFGLNDSTPSIFTELTAYIQIASDISSDEPTDADLIRKQITQAHLYEELFKDSKPKILSSLEEHPTVLKTLYKSIDCDQLLLSQNKSKGIFFGHEGNLCLDPIQYLALQQQIKTTMDLTKALKPLAEGNQILLIEALGEHIKTIIRYSGDLTEILKLLPEVNRILLIKALGEHIKTIMKYSMDLTQLLEVLKLLPEVNRILLIKALEEHIKTIMKYSMDLTQLLEVLKLLPEDNKALLINMLGNDLNTFFILIRDHDYVSRLCPILENLSEANQILFLDTLDYRFSQSIRYVISSHVDGLTYLLKKLSPVLKAASYHKILMIIFDTMPENDISALIKDNPSCMSAPQKRLLTQISKYKKFIVTDTNNPITHAKALLGNYVHGRIHGAGVFGRLISGHTNRSYTDIAGIVLKQDYSSVRELIHAINTLLHERHELNIKDLGPDSSLKNRIEFIISISGLSLEIITELADKNNPQPSLCTTKF